MLPLCLRRLFQSFCVLVLAWGSANSALAEEIELIGRVSLPGTTRDLSGLKGTVAKKYPRDLFGGISAIDYTGSGNRYLLLADRGPLDGAVSYPCRFHEVEIEIDPDKSPAITTRLLKTHLLKDIDGRSISGAAAKSDGPLPPLVERMDPEGIRCSPDHKLYISDEYGPAIYEVTEHGVVCGEMQIPGHFRIAVPHADADQEASLNSQGRQPNKGFEGLALTPDGRYLVAIAQAPLIQDSTPTGKGRKRKGQFSRLFVLDLKTGQNQQWAYPLTETKNGISEILAISPTEFLVLERDGDGGNEAHFKAVTHVDASEATDVSAISQLPHEGLPQGVKPVKVQPWLNLLDERFGLKGPQMPEKFEGLTFGPTLPDGRRTLVVAVDNDFETDVPTELFVFAIPTSKLHIAGR
ncbi:hypothetical protein Enr10x_10790 [Gimesia panareensis]|uniref:Phytase-like domain-containing protein n=1 Tax=Gimesia panareensis TaxID=2527978 RepID=A0A517Q2H7_9PLAN|nr:esterase-like activity of phytase family protein [Gimesia panareensis]QDT25782.1 hypothetical protein Enr10x_10790 [Gimesia panareensis]